MLEEVKKPQTTQEKYDDLKKEVGQAFFDYGQTQYEMELKAKQHAEVGVKLHNLNQKALEIQKQLAKEKIKDEALKVNLSPELA